jgi:hypothetical protein
LNSQPLVNSQLLMNKPVTAPLKEESGHKSERE